MIHSSRNARTNLKKISATFLTVAMLGAVLVASVFVLGTRSAYAHDCPAEGCADGRMTGGGRLAGDMIVTHGFELHCGEDDRPNNLEINWDGGNRFHLDGDSLVNIKCIDDPAIAPKPPSAPFDRYEADGFGSYNGVDGYQIHLEFTDAGEPGTEDHAFIVIHGGSPDTTVLIANQFLENGNHQAHKANK